MAANASGVFRNIWTWFLQGIALLAPVALTLALLIWLGDWSEKTFGGLIKTLLPDDWYFKGLGLLSGILVTLAVGLAANLFLVRRAVRLVESILQRIPLVTSLFQAFKDVARLFSQDPDQQLGQVVAVDISGVRLVGFVMQREAVLPGRFDAGSETRVAVYVAMSYQLGGFTVHVPESSVTPLDVAPDRAMRAVLTGGALDGTQPHGKPRKR